jgi:hypothetical protein
MLLPMSHEYDRCDYRCAADIVVAAAGRHCDGGATSDVPCAGARSDCVVKMVWGGWIAPPCG